MIAQAGDNHALADGLRTSPSLTDSQRPGYPDIGDTETPNVKPDALDSKASPLKPTPGEFPSCYMASVADFGQLADMNVFSAGSATIPSGLGHAKQDLNNKLDDAAPGIGVHTCSLNCTLQCKMLWLALPSLSGPPANMASRKSSCKVSTSVACDCRPYVTGWTAFSASRSKHSSNSCCQGGIKC